MYSSVDLLELMILTFILFFYVGLQQCIVLGKDQQCRTSKDCSPDLCIIGYVLCFDGKCVCSDKIRRNVSFKKDNVYMGKCSCGCKPHCVLGLCTCPCC